MSKLLLLPALSLLSTLAWGQNVYPPLIPQNNTNLLPLNNTWTGTNTITNDFTVTSTGNWWAPSANFVKLNDRVQVGGATILDGLSSPVSKDWATALEETWLTTDGVTYLTGAAQYYELAVETQPNSASAAGAGGIFAGAQSLHSTSAGTSTIGIFGFVANNNATLQTGAWALYGECHKLTNPVGGCYGMEVDTRSLFPTITPWAYQQGDIIGVQIGCGAGLVAAGQYDCSAAIQIVDNPKKWKVGINFMNTSLLSGEAISMPTGSRIQWWNASGNALASIQESGTSAAATTALNFGDLGVQFTGNNGTAGYTLAYFFPLTSGTPVDYLTFAPGLAGAGASIGVGGETNADLNLNPAGTGVLSVGGVRGVSCSGAPTGSFSTYKGIVTHC